MFFISLCLICAALSEPSHDGDWCLSCQAQGPAMARSTAGLPAL